MDRNMSADYKKTVWRNEWFIMGMVVSVFLIVLPLLNVLPGENSWFWVSNFRLNLLGKFMALAILALGIDLIWGYTGILSLGHGVFFGLGGYCMAMYLLLKVGTAGHYESNLPDFMVWNGLTELPWFWKPMYHAWAAIPCVFIVPMVCALALGYLTFKSRVGGVYFSIVTQALALVFSITLIGQQPYTGGTNGLNDFRSIFGFPLRGPNLPKTQLGLYVATVLILIGVYMLCRWITRSKLGRVLTAIRDDEKRVRFSGYDTANFRIFVFCLSAALAGIAGALFVPQAEIISPSNVGIVPSIEMVLWVAVGGRGTLVGAVLGALLVNSAKSGLSESFPSVWLYFLGALFVGVVVFFPKGCLGLFKQLQFRRSNKNTHIQTENISKVSAKVKRKSERLI